MTIAALSEGRVQIEGDGMADRVDLPFQFIDQNNLEVIHRDLDGNTEIWRYQQAPGNWSYTGGDFATGTVFFEPSALKPGETLTVLLVSDFRQPYSLAGGEIDPAVMEKAMDRSAINMQSVASRALLDKNGGYDLEGRRVVNGLEAADNNDLPTLQQVLEIAALPGAPGPKGPVGDQGAVGPAGAQGPEGPQGPQGERGPVGYEGPRGPTGLQGPEGPRGPEGPTGPTGSQGPIGPQGPQGPEGPVGKSFDPDASGLTADRDAYNAETANFSFLDVETGTVYFKLSNDIGAWSAGVPFGRGPQGLQGPQGIQGPAGPIGLNHRGTWASSIAYAVKDTVFHDGSYFICLTENSDVQPHVDAAEWDILVSRGERGLQGQQGIQGPEGRQGAQGPEGVQGPKGDPGAQGPTGAQGPQGAQGDPGLTYRGIWSSAQTYTSDETVTYNGSSFISLRINTGKNPSTSAEDWGMLASRGETGAAGATGPQGPQGPAGSTSYNAGTLDGLDSSKFVRSDTSDTMSGSYTITSNLTVHGNTYSGKNGGGDSWHLFYDDNSNAWRSFGWDDSQNCFVMEENDGGLHKVSMTDTQSSASATNFPIGHVLIASSHSNNVWPRNSSKAIYIATLQNNFYVDSGSPLGKGAQLTGTWRYRGYSYDGGSTIYSLYQRVA